MKRRFVLVLLVVTIVLSLAMSGCGANNNPMQYSEESSATSNSTQASKESNATKVDLDEMKAEIRALYGENKPIADNDYDKSLAVKCVNGTFVGQKTDGIVAYKGIPYVGQQPVGKYRWKAPVDIIPNDGVFHHDRGSDC